MARVNDKNPTCPECQTLEGDCCYPYYGLAPHVTKWFEGCKSEMIGPVGWPPNFVPDENDSSCGTYAYCPSCYRGDSFCDKCKVERCVPNSKFCCDCGSNLIGG